jgi:predicted glycosyltransferase involved in capsule biosynthesis
LSVLDCRILVLEADSKAKLQNENWILGVEYLFIKDNSPVFYRTRYINMLLHMADTDIVSIWDTDVLISLEQLFEAISMIEQGCTIAYPYNGDFVMLTNIESDMARQRFDVEYLKGKKMQSIFGRKSCGGIFLVHRRRYLDCGGENEHFTGWGPEDAERLRRVSILGHKVSWTNAGQAYHLNHPRGKNSNFFEEEAAIRLRKELCKVCSMDKEQLRNYLSL